MTSPAASSVVRIVRVVAWPVAILLLACFETFVFRNEIRTMMPKVTRGDFQLSGKGLKLSFEQSVQAQIAQIDELQKIIGEIVDRAKISPDEAIVFSWNIIAQKVKDILTSSGWGNFLDAKSGIQKLADLGVVAGNTSQNLNLIEIEMERMFRGETSRPENTEVVLETAINIIRMISVIQIQKTYVESVNVPLCLDSQCKTRVEGINGIIVKTIFENSVILPRYHIYPTTRKNYVVGEKISQKFSLEKTISETWYVDPKDHIIKVAWLASALFVGDKPFN